MKHFTIPIFIPELACPFQCIFCNQKKISGMQKVPSLAEIESKIHLNLSTIPVGDSRIEIGFFGGNFTGIPLEEQENYLKSAFPFIKSGRISGIRLSTRPDYINYEVLDLLKKYNVETIEIGAQSFDPEVLKLSGRGHKVDDTIKASEMIKEYNFKLGLQMMIGLPGDTLQKSIYTAKKISELGADNTRIYPTLVIKDTNLEKFYRANKYIPLSLDEAVTRAKEVYKIFEESGVRVIRMGLHPSEDLLSGSSLIAGPFHVSFKELVMTELWNEQVLDLTVNDSRCIEIYVPCKQLNYAAGYNAKNKIMLQSKFNSVKFKNDLNLVRREYRVVYS